MTQAEDLINEELGKKRKTIEYVEKELVFIEGWLAKDPGNMEEYLKGRQSGLREVLTILK